jgi:hypothetical protein
MLGINMKNARTKQEKKDLKKKLTKLRTEKDEEETLTLLIALPGR